MRLPQALRAFAMTDSDEIAAPLKIRSTKQSSIIIVKKARKIKRGFPERLLLWLFKINGGF